MRTNYLDSGQNIPRFHAILLNTDKIQKMVSFLVAFFLISVRHLIISTVNHFILLKKLSFYGIRGP